MRYLEQVKTENNSFIDYLKGSLIFIFFHFLGQIPLYIYLISKSPNIEGYRDQNELLSSLPSNTTLFLILLPFAVTAPFIYIVVTKLHRQSFKSLVLLFWNNIDHTQANVQFCDKGNQYRTVIFTQKEMQKETAKRTRKLIGEELGKRIETQLITAGKFYPAEEYHQDYYKKN